MNQELQEKRADLYRSLMATQAEWKALCKASGQGLVEDYAFETLEGKTVRLSELFGDHEDLIVVHHMGIACPNCTLWADTYNGVLDHLLSRTAFVVSTPDSTEVITKLAESRGWRFPLVSTAGNSFKKDFGYESDPGTYHPGFSTFRRTDQGVENVANDVFGPGDLYCGLWHMFDLLGSEREWKAKLKYGEGA